MRRPSPPSILTVTVITTVTIIFWIFFSVYQILTGDVDVDVPAQLLKPISPTLNQKALSKLNEGVSYQRDEVIHFSAGENFKTPLTEQSPSEENPEEITPTTSPEPSPTIFPINIEEVIIEIPNEELTQ